MRLNIISHHYCRTLPCVLLVLCTVTFVIPASAEPGQPRNLRSAIYSPRVAELTWDRASEPLTRYDVFRDNRLLSTAQFGISFFDPTLEAEQSYSYSVVAIDRQGERSESSVISVVTPGDDVTQPLVPSPQNLKIARYSPRVAELFWERAVDPLTQYDVFRNNDIQSAAQFGISYFDPTLDPNTSVQYTVVAIDAEGNRSTGASVTMSPDSGGLKQPENLIVAVYSVSAAELFWTRQEVGQKFVVVREDTVLATTDGTSFFDDTVPSIGTYSYQVMAVDEAGRRSPPASISATFGDTSLPAVTAQISLDNAENLAREVMSITSSKVFEALVDEAQRLSDLAVAVSFASFTNQNMEPNGITLIRRTVAHQCFSVWHKPRLRAT